VKQGFTDEQLQLLDRLGVGDRLITSFITQIETISVNEFDINTNKAKNQLQIWRLQKTKTKQKLLEMKTFRLSRCFQCTLTKYSDLKRDC